MPIFLSPPRLAEIRSRLEADAGPTSRAYAPLLAEADAALDHVPRAPAKWHVPFFYVDPDGHRAAKGGLMGDANAAYALGLTYALTGDERYAAAAARLIMAWTALGEMDASGDSTLSFSYHFPAFIFAADLIRPSPAWTPASEAAFGDFLRAKAVPMNTMHHRNNWANWGVVLVSAAAAFLDDDALFNQAIARWKELLDDQVDPEGVLHHEVTRNEGTGGHGLWYSNFSLMPMALAAEIARLRGIELYDYRSPSGRTMRQAFERLAPWLREPRTFPYYKGDDLAKLVGSTYVSYFELLNSRWPHPDATALLDSLRPLTADHSTPHLTLTHAGIDPEL